MSSVGFGKEVSANTDSMLESQTDVLAELALHSFVFALLPFCGLWL